MKYPTYNLKKLLESFVLIIFLVNPLSVASEVYTDKNTDDFIERLQSRYPNGKFIIESEGVCHEGISSNASISHVYWEKYDLYKKNSMYYITKEDGLKKYLIVLKSSDITLIKWPNLYAAALNVMIPRSEIRYNKYTDPNRIIDKILSNPGVYYGYSRLKYMADVGISAAFIDPRSLSNLDKKLNFDRFTIAAALNRIVNIFGGIILYSECSTDNSKKRFVVSYYPNLNISQK